MASNNPFMDPSVTNAASSDNNAEKLPTSIAAPSPAPAKPAENEPFPGQVPSTREVAIPVSNAVEPEWKRKEREGETLNAEDLRMWEADLKKREREGGMANSDGRANNWPCWPKPCTRIAIEEDIVGENQEVRQHFVKLCLWCWYLNMFMLFWNFACMCAYVDDKDANVGLVFLALTYLVLGSGGAFYLWFKLAYRAAETSSNFLMFMWLGLFGLCTLFWAAVAVGVPESAMAGFIVMVKLYDNDNSAAGTMCLIGFICYCLTFCAMGWTWLKGRAIYNGTGGTEKTKETAEGAAKVAKAAKNSGAV